MDTGNIKKRLSTFMSPKGYLSKVSNDVALEVLRGWESWTGPGAEYARQLGISSRQMGTMIQKGKRLIKQGVVTESEFKELPIGASSNTGLLGGANGIELKLESGHVIGFSQVEMLVEFLKKYS